ALTGDVDAAGRLLPVNPDTLPLKLEAAFFSRLEAVGVPAGQAEAARDLVRPWAAQFPRRRFDIIPLETLRDLFDDRRCALRRRSATAVGWMWRRMNKPYLNTLALPFLVILAAAWGFFSWWPQMRPWIDPQPGYVTAPPQSPLRYVYNRDRKFLWAYDLSAGARRRWLPLQSDMPPDAATPITDIIYDIDGDGEGEVLLGTDSDWLYQCRNEHRTARQLLFDRKGRLRWELPQSRQSSPFPGARDPEMYLVRNSFVRWRPGGGADLVQVWFNERGHRANCLAWIDGLTGVVKAQQWKMDWWFALLAVPEEGHEELWTGTRDPDDGFAMLACFRQGIPDGQFAYPSHSDSVECYRFPLPDVLRRLHRPMNVKLLRPDMKGDFAVVLECNASKDLLDRLCGYTYHFQAETGSFTLEYPDGPWGARLMWGEICNLPPPGRTDYRQELSQIQRWDGRRWVALDGVSQYPDSLYCLPRSPAWWPEDLEQPAGAVPAQMVPPRP
ncbi:MAG: hypothetical protein C4519_27365, partial [Desulfobacteraceae bacterium]